MSGGGSEEFLRRLREENALLRERERELEERNEELLAQKEELTAAIDAFVEKSDSLEITVQKLKQRNNELDQILYRTSHDLLAPLTSIEGLMYIYRSEDRPRGPVEEDNLSRHVLAKIHQMKDVLKALGTLAHASFDAFSFSEVNVLGFTRKLVSELQYLPNFSLVSFVFSIDEDLVFETDPFLFGIVLKSLLANAITFRSNDRNGEIVLRARRNDGNFEFQVQDDGEGVDEDKREKIFEMFYRGSIRSIGPGLGLYVVKTLLERFRGEILLSSVPGHTCFTLILPIQK